MALAFPVIKARKNTQSFHNQSKNTFKRHIDLLLLGEEDKTHHFLIKILINSYLIIHYTVEENGFVVIVFKLLVQQKFYKFILMNALQLMVKKLLRYLKKVNMSDSKIMKEK